MNLVCASKPVDLATLQIASKLLTAQGIRHVLVGTAALKLHGSLPKGVNAEDADFLVERAPYVKEPLPKELSSTNDSVACKIDGVKVDFIVTNRRSNNKRMRKFFTKNPEVICDVPVADLADVLGLKLSAARCKDFDFLHKWSMQYGALPERKKLGFLKRIFGRVA